MVDAMEACIFYREQLVELIGIEDIPSSIPIICKTDNKALHESAYSSTQILDKRLRIETAIIREVLEQRKIHKLEWIPSCQQVADGLTKRGIASSKILDHFGNVKSPLP